MEKALLLCVLFVLFTSSYALTIDDFENSANSNALQGTAMSSGYSTTVSNSKTDSAVLGFERDVSATFNSNSGYTPATGYVNAPYSNYGYAYISYPFGWSGSVTFQYDGSDNSINNAKLLSADFLAAGNKFILTIGTSRVIGSEETATFLIKVYTSLGETCVYPSRNIPYNKVDSEIRFDEVTCNGLQNVKAIELIFTIQASMTRGALNFAVWNFEVKQNVNDDFTKAITEAIPNIINFDTSGADSANPLSDFPELKTSNSLLWYKIEPTDTLRIVDLDTCGSNTDSVLFIYTNTLETEFSFFDFSTYRTYAINDDRSDHNPSCDSLSSKISNFAIGAFETAYIIIATAPGSQTGEGILTITLDDYTNDLQAVINSASIGIETKVDQILVITAELLEDTTDILADTASILTDTSDIIANEVLILADTTDLLEAAESIQTAATSILEDTADILEDTTSISQDTESILEDTTSIQADTTDILEDTADLLEDTSAILEDTASISQDTESILEDTTSIQADTTDILEDTTDILEDTASIKTDTTNIVDNTENIMEDTASLLLSTASIQTDTNSLQTDTGNILADTAVIKTGITNVRADIAKLDVAKGKEYLSISASAVPLEFQLPPTYGGSMDQLYSIVTAKYASQQALASTNPAFSIWFSTPAPSGNASKATKGSIAYNYNIQQYQTYLTAKAHDNAFLSLQKAYKALLPVAW